MERLNEIKVLIEAYQNEWDKAKRQELKEQLMNEMRYFLRLNIGTA